VGHPASFGLLLPGEAVPLKGCGTDHSSKLDGYQNVTRPAPCHAGTDEIDAVTVENWMLTNLDRIHFFMPGAYGKVRDALEVRGRVGSVFESASHGRAQDATDRRNGE
jgi:hypothetical protein